MQLVMDKEQYLQDINDFREAIANSVHIMNNQDEIKMVMESVKDIVNLSLNFANLMESYTKDIEHNN